MRIIEPVKYSQIETMSQHLGYFTPSTGFRHEDYIFAMHFDSTTKILSIICENREGQELFSYAMSWKSRSILVTEPNIQRIKRSINLRIWRKHGYLCYVSAHVDML